ncbi:MAG: hypothetical protein ACI8VT_002683 [Saprospiraceae bacterium]|jgi:hypothetical protein
MKIKILVNTVLLVFCIGQIACDAEKKDKSSKINSDGKEVLFEEMDGSHTRIDFSNQIKEDEDYHYFNYPYIYNGAGVAVGDLNNDGLPDIYFSGNRTQDELYLNTGNLVFKKITKAAGIEDRENAWHTGVCMWDANADGLLDIYVCRSGKSKSPELLKNLLYINQGDMTFVESAQSFGLDDSGHSTQAYPFDFDKDGDLDLYVVNHRIDFIKNSFYDFDDDKKRDSNSSDHLYRNNGNNNFSEISKAAGTQNKAWGLSAAIDDYNNDGWDDIYVANDFHQPDYLYLNQKDGTFKENLAAYFKHTSFYSMGSDIADINNDGMTDLVVLDMVSESHLRSKRMMAAMSTDNFWLLAQNGYHYQYMNNMLQLNQGTGPYSEIAQLAGIAKTDWSWAPLLADFDNDGWKDLFVTNGIKKDVTDNDFRVQMDKEMKAKGGMPWNVANDMFPSSTVPNYIFQNNHQLKFENKTNVWGLFKSINSNGAAYADLDGDGDLELIINNMDAPASIYKNSASENQKNNYLSLELSGPISNPFAVGAEVRLYMDGQVQCQKIYPARGFQSSVDYTLHFGISTKARIDSLLIVWPDGKSKQLINVPPNQKLKLSYDPIDPKYQAETRTTKTIFQKTNGKSGLTFEHKENAFNDFNLEVLLPHKQSEFGPMIATADVNNDGLEDCFIGGAHLQAGRLFLQQPDGTFIPAKSQAWESDSISEDLESLFFDADQDGDMDLYIVSGGAVFLQGHPALQDRLYINDGSGNFKRDKKALPEMLVSGLSVCAGDMDGDGDLDLFVGGRLIPGKYPLPPRSYLLENQAGVFTDVTDLLAPSLMNPGLVNDAVFTDYDGDNDLDLLVVGEWMPLSVFENEEGFFLNGTAKLNLQETSGWWSRIAEVDWDKDGDQDYILGNIGENNKFQPGPDHPLHIYLNDFDRSGSLDIYLAKEKDKVILPVRGRECSSQQMPDILKKFPTYKAFGEANLDEILGVAETEEAYHLQAVLFSSGMLLNEQGNLTFQALPVEAQLSQINGMITKDFNEDGYPDLLIAGNQYGAEVETVRYDASGGMLFLNDKNGGFITVSSLESGFSANGNVKSLVSLKMGKSGVSTLILLSNNNSSLEKYMYQH